MATAKRSLVDSEDTSDLQKKLKTSDDPTHNVDQFIHWCGNGEMTLSEKVKVDKEGSCAQYGMIAVEDIDKGETLFDIPRTLLLTQDTCSIAQLLKDEADCLKSESGWVPLLVALLHEYTKPDSRWKPYFQCFPDFSQLDLPMFWSQDDINSELSGTGVIEAVNRDLKGITQEFTKTVAPFISKHTDVFSPECNDLDLYKKMVAFVMAYSFTEAVGQDDDDDEFDYDLKSPPMMVPMADALNHVAKNNAKLKFGKESLKMIACKAIKKGEEVFNTYGQLANWQLLQMYGFAEPYPNNHYDAVEISMPIIYDSLVKKKTGVEEKLIKEKWNFLKSADIVVEDGSFIIGCEGFLTEDETVHALKVLCMSAREFDEHLENEGWMEEEEDEDESLTFDSIEKLSKEKRDILRGMAEECVMGYKTTLKEEDEKLQNTQLTTRQRNCVYVRHGQLKLLQKLIDMCSTKNTHSTGSETDNTKNSTKEAKAASNSPENNTHNKTTESQ